MRKILARLDSLDERTLGRRGWLPWQATRRPLVLRHAVLLAMGGCIVFLLLGVALRQLGPLSALRDQSLWDSIVDALPMSFLPVVLVAMQYLVRRRWGQPDHEPRSESSK
jgi:hypothetical protein